MSRNPITVRNTLLVSSLLIVSAGCHQDMWNQPTAKPQSKSDTMFSDGRNSRAPVTGAVAYNTPRTDRPFYTGFDDRGQLVKEFPVAVNEELLKRGQERFKIFCTPCHSELGDGKGFVAQRGFTLARPVGNYHSDRLRKMPVGHFFDVITNGYGTMYPFKNRIEPYDRWAIVSYIRVLQESQYTPIDEIPAENKRQLETMPRTADQDAPPEPRVGTPPSRNLNTPGGAVRTIVPLGRRVDAPVDSGTVDSTSVQPPAGAGVARPGGGPR